MKTKIVTAAELKAGDTIIFDSYVRHGTTWVVMSANIVDGGITMVVAHQPTGCLTSDMFVESFREFTILDNGEQK